MRKNNKNAKGHTNNIDQPSSFIVSEDAMRPKSTKKECFYCHQPVGKAHLERCILVKKGVKIRMTVDYDIEVPARWEKPEIESYRNEGSWCASYALDELQHLSLRRGCLCNSTHFEYLGGDSKPYLNECADELIDPDNAEVIK